MDSSNKQERNVRHGTILLTLCLLLATVAHASQASAAETGKPAQAVYPAGSQKSFKGPDNLFTGDVP